MQAARPLQEWLTDDATPVKLKQRLALAQDMRHFAVTELQLPDNPSYQTYADLQRRSAVWNVVAAPEFSLTLKTWCFPVAGCVGYRGYFAETDAQAMANALREQGFEVSVYGVPAYSTLGWSNWVGGDPLLNTFIHNTEGDLARLLFHEMAHQVVYVSDDTTFNESFATAVERLGGKRWLEWRTPAVPDDAQQNRQRQQFRALTRATRQKLQQIYSQNEALVHSQHAQKAIKTEAMMQFKANYAELKKSWGGYSGFDTWVAQANNASFGALAAYDELVPGFEALFAQHEHNWLRFYAAVKQLANRPQAQRTQFLIDLGKMQHG